MLALIKKDILIAKKMWFVVMLLSLLIPLFIRFAGGDITIPSGVVLSVMSIILSMMIFTSIDQEEDKYPKAKALLTTVGYSRKLQILHRYILMAVFFLFCILVIFVESLLVTGLAPVTFMDLSLAAFAFAFVSSLYLALTTTLGTRASQYLVMLVIFAISMGPVLISKFEIKIDLSFFQRIHPALLATGFLIAAVFVVSLSLIISLAAYRKKDL